MLHDFMVRAGHGHPASETTRRRMGVLGLLLMLAMLSLGAVGCAEESNNNGGTTDPQTDASEEDASDDAQEDTEPQEDVTVDDPMDAVEDTTAQQDAADPEDAQQDADEPEEDAAPDATPQEDAVEDTEPDADEPIGVDPDLNEDGTVNILVIGTSRSIARNAEAFSAQQIATELQNILQADPSITAQVNVVAEDIHNNAQVTLGLGQAGTEYTWNHASHSLAQYYYWPEGFEARMDHLAGRAEHDWDHVVIGADPHIVGTLPGYYALGANKIAAQVAQGDAQPHLLMVWPRDEASIDHFAEHTRRISHRAAVPLPTIAAGRAWQALPEGKKDGGNAHPSPNGAYLAAASIYTHLCERSADTSDYTYDDEIAQAASATLQEEANNAQDFGPREFGSPFKGGDIADRVLSFNHTGTSSERGILGGLRWVLGKARVQLNNGGQSPINFNYGRANTNFEPNKRYQVDPERFDFSLGFPMQDNGNHGDLSMLYGLDQRLSHDENGTDLGVALYMVRTGELPNARAVPIRTLYARIKEVTPSASAFRDPWHMHRDLDKATGAFMYTLLTGHCALDEEPADVDSDAWRQWTAHRIGYETAWTLMHLSGVAPCFKVLPESAESTSVTPEQSAQLSISFANTAPGASVTVTLTTDNDAAVTISPSELVFTPENHGVPQTVTMTGVDGEPAQDVFVITAATESDDAAFDGLEDRWQYTVNRN